MKWNRRATITIALVILGLLGAVWFLPVGEGDYTDSPDGRYGSSVSTLRCGTWFQGRIEYIEIKIVEQATGRCVWKARRYQVPGETAPDYGDRRQKFSIWAADSKSVVIPVYGMVNSVWVVP